jgi:hypothetical protein
MNLHKPESTDAVASIETFIMDRAEQAFDQPASLGDRLEDARVPGDKENWHPFDPRITIQLTPKQYLKLERQLTDMHDRLRPNYLTEEAAREFAAFDPETISVEGYLKVIPALFSLAFDTYVAENLGYMQGHSLSLALAWTDEKPALDETVWSRVANQLIGAERYNLNATPGFQLDPCESYFADDDEEE